VPSGGEAPPGSTTDPSPSTSSRASSQKGDSAAPSAVVVATGTSLRVPPPPQPGAPAKLSTSTDAPMRPHRPTGASVSRDPVSTLSSPSPNLFILVLSDDKVNLVNLGK
jgi:hypothetical protein